MVFYPSRRAFISKAFHLGDAKGKEGRPLFLKFFGRALIFKASSLDFEEESRGRGKEEGLGR